VQPAEAFFQVSGQPSQKAIKFTNKGDVNILLRNGKYCPEKKKPSKCTDLGVGTRLYAGESWTLNLPKHASQSGTVQFGLYDGKKEYTQVFSLKEKTESELEKVS